MEVLFVDSHIKVTAHAAGHVLGAVMWEVEIDGQTILYTGDFSDEEGSFIPPYQLPSRFRTPGNLDMLIMECTYGNTQFQSLEQRRNVFVQTILSTIQEGGRVLVPCYGIGYTQELLALLQQVWTDNHLTVAFSIVPHQVDPHLLQLSRHIQYPSIVLVVFCVDYTPPSSAFRANQALPNGLPKQPRSFRSTCSASQHDYGCVQSCLSVYCEKSQELCHFLGQQPVGYVRGSDHERECKAERREGYSDSVQAPGNTILIPS